ncbi:MAG: arginine--tRNA ligase [Actinomycetota bacterium]
MIVERLEDLVRTALEAARRDGVLSFETPPALSFERPKRREHGDWATNVALTAARGQGNPREIAQALIDRLPDTDLVVKSEVAGPGFINFHLSDKWLHEAVRSAADPDSGFGRSDVGAGKRVNVEYVSANPTGPINVVSGRHAAVGDAIANLLEATGHAVTREYYVNDAGRQIRLFAESIEARYLQRFGREANLPEEGYQGDYVAGLADEIAEEIGDELVDVSVQKRVETTRQLGLDRMLDQMRASLERFGTKYEVWQRESELHQRGLLEEGIARLKEKGLVEEREGAVWFRSSDFGDDKDRVLVRAGGEPTYFAADVGYLLHKFGRGYEALIYLWGAGHHGAVPRLMAAAEGLGFDRERVEVPLVQTVRLRRGGEAVIASKRKGNVIPLDDLVDEVGVDAARYTFLTRSIDAPLDFDIELVKEQAPENPVYYVQYAHARICSILRKAGEPNLDTDATALERLSHPSESALMRKIAAYEETIIDAATQRAPQKVTRYVEELASTFSAFYRDCQVISDDDELTHARLTLCLATKSVIAGGLGVLGVTAPERM